MTERPADLESVYRAHGVRLWRALLGYTGDPEVASDALAEAFAQAIARGDAVRSSADWVWTAAFKIAAGELKRRRIAGPPVTEDSYEMAEPLDDLIAALASIPRNQRLAVVMHDYADRPTDEIAAVLGATRATVHVHLSRGRRRLRSLLEDRDG